MSLAHYIGFVSELPSEIIASANSSLVLGATGPFVAYGILAFGASKVFTGVLQFIMPPIHLLFDRLQIGMRRMTWGEARKFIKSHNNSIAVEPYAFALFHFIIAIFLFFALYINFKLSLYTGIVLIACLAYMALTTLLKSSFFYRPKINDYIKKIKGRSNFRQRIGAAFIIAMAPVLVILSFAVGYERMRFLMNLQERQIHNNYYSGYANFLASANGMLLIVEKNEAGRRFLLFTPEYAMGTENKKGAFPLLNINSSQSEPKTKF